MGIINGIVIKASIEVTMKMMMKMKTMMQTHYMKGSFFFNEFDLFDAFNNH